jgi:NAD(P)H-nitrite reductase large subunit/rubredoxin
MEKNETKKWRCEVCFEEFEGDEPPVPCPVCGAGRDQFVEISVEDSLKQPKETAAKTGDAESKRWRCQVCFQEFEGDEPPVPCPVCGAGRDQFVEISLKVSVENINDVVQNILIIGNGAAGYYTAKNIREKSKNASLTIVSSEKYLSYYRPQVSAYLAKGTLEDSMFISSEAWYKSNNINLILSKTITKLDTDNKKVFLDNNEELSYDKLILANGSRSSILPVKGIDKVNVFTLRNIDDANNIKDTIASSKNAVVIGGGLLGLEAASELKESGLNVTVVEFMPGLLGRQLDSEGAEIFQKSVDTYGINVLLGESAEEILGEPKVTGVKLKSGKILDADLVLFSVGIIPNKEIASNTSIEVNRGIIVNDKMATSVEGIYACGDVAEANGRVYGNWPAAIEMAKVAALNVLGLNSQFKDFVPSTVYEGMGIEIFSCGDVNSSYKSLEIKDNEENFIEKIFFKEDIIVGGYIIGDTSSAQNIVKAIVDKATFESIKKTLLK